MKPRYRVQATSRPHLTVVRTIAEPCPTVKLRLLEINSHIEHLDAIAIVGIMRDGRIYSGFAPGNSLFRLIGGTSYLLKRLHDYAETT